MNAAEFAKLVGPHLLHVTPKSNEAGIRKAGLLPAADLARQAGKDPATLILRKERRRLETPHGPVELNHQLPLLAGSAHVDSFLDGFTLESWAAQLDERVFLWPTRREEAFADSIEGEVAVFTLDSIGFFEAFGPQISLSPINSGHARRRPAKRGSWLYVPASAPVRTLRENRSRRGLIVGRDTVVEVSVTCPISAETLADLTR